VDGKTNKRTAIARDRVVDFLWRQAQLNSRITAGDFDALIAAKLDEPVFTTRLSATVIVHNLNGAFNALLDELDLKTGADDRTRTLYSWRHSMPHRTWSVELAHMHLADSLATALR
jgi:hypothetical protein